MQFPDIHISEADKVKDNKQWYRSFADAAISYFQSTSANRAKWQSLQDGYNGLRGDEYIKSIQYLTNIYGFKSKLKYVDYRLARTKVQDIVGEYLEMPLSATVYAINEEATKAKTEKQAQAMGFMVAKPYIDEVRKGGLNVFEGINMPNPEDKESVFAALNVKRQTEVVMQHMLDKKVQKEFLKEKFGRNFQDISITSGCFGVCERDASGKDTYRPIDLKDAIFVESASDPMCLRSPFMGERRMMHKHEIFALFKNLTKEQKKEIENMASNPGDYLDRNSYYLSNGIVAMAVYRIQWKGFKPIYNKISPANESDIPYIKELSEDQALSDKTRKEIDAGKYNVETKYMQCIYEATVIGNVGGGGIYTDMKESEYIIQTTAGGNKYVACYDYTACLVGTVNGVRVSVFELADNLSEVYNVIRFQINRELAKMKGKSLSYDRAYLPKNKSFKQVMKEVTEDGLIDYDSSQDGTQDPNAARNALGMHDFGGSQSLPILIQLGLDVEHAIDIITGISRARQGFSKASQTASGIESDVQGSMKMTFHLFYYMELYQAEVMKRLCEKTKINWTYLKQDLPGLLYSDEEEFYLNLIRDMSFDDYDVYVSNAKKEERIRNVARSLFPQEINASKLRAKDVIEFEMTETLSEGLGVLHKAWTDIEGMNMQQMQQQQQIKGEQGQQMSQMQQQLTDMQNETKKEQLLLKGDIEYRNAMGLEKAKQEGVKEGYVAQALMDDAEMLRQIALTQQEKINEQQQGMQGM